jgi:hypothetical protein
LEISTGDTIIKNVTLKEVVGVALLGTVATSTSVADETSELTANEQLVANVETSELVDEQWMVDIDTPNVRKQTECWIKGGTCDSLEWCMVDWSDASIAAEGLCNGTDTDMRITPSEVTIKVGEKLPKFNVTACGTPLEELLVNFNGVPLEESSNIVFDRPGDHEITVEDNAGQKTVIKVHVVEGEANLATLASFTAEAVDGKVILNWITATEIENAGFLVWRAQSLIGQATDDPNDYTEVQQVGSWINTNSKDGMLGASYSYEDAGMVPGTTYYYALEDIDDNGKSTYHMAHIISVTAE